MLVWYGSEQALSTTAALLFYKKAFSNAAAVNANMSSESQCDFQQQMGKDETVVLHEPVQSSNVMVSLPQVRKLSKDRW